MHGLEMVCRQISEAGVAQALAALEQTQYVREGRTVYQSRIERDEPPKTDVLLVVVDVDRGPSEVVTTCRSRGSKVLAG